MRKTVKSVLAITIMAMMSLGISMVSNADYDWSETWEDDDWDDWEDEDSDEAEGDGWYQDTQGYWHYNSNGRDAYDEFKEIDGKTYYFDNRGRMAVSTYVKTSGAAFPIYYYFGADGARMTGWIQETSGEWAYALPSTGEMLTRGIVYDGGLYYVINKSYLATGVTTIEWETGTYYDFTDTNGWDAEKNLPYKVGWGTVDLGAGGVTLDKLPVSGGMTDEYVNRMKEQYAGNNNTSSSSSASSSERFAIADYYVPSSMASRGYYDYEVVSKEYTEDYMYGGFVAVYKVKVPQAGSHHTGYLRIMVNADGSYHSNSFN